MSSVLQVTNLSKTFGHGDIFRDVSFTLNAGETIGLFGPSGCGKSTLGRCILGLEKLTKGSVLFEGKDIFRLDRKERSCLQAKMQMVFQHPEVSFDPRRRLIYSVTEPRCIMKSANPKMYYTPFSINPCSRSSSGYPG
jgi:peptide/nickel transport system ATP-binding protein